MRRIHKEKELNELQSIKKKNKELKRENLRLRKTLDRVSQISEMEEESISIGEIETGKIKKSLEERCLECGSNNLTNLTMGSKIIKVCRSCKWRKAV